MRALVPALLLLAACQEPFGTDRHDLVGFRVAAVRVEAVDDSLTAHAALVVDGKVWSDDRVALSWHLTDDLATDTIAALELDDAVAYGPAATVDRWAGRDGLALVAVSDDIVYRAVIDLKDTIGPAPTPTRLETFDLGLALDTVEAPALELEARRALEESDVADAVDAGAFTRIRADVASEVRVRWMSTAPTGTFLELDRHTTDWVAGELLIDDDEIEERRADVDGPRTVLALALDPTEGGANAWLAHDLWVGQPPAGVRTTSGRWLATDTAVAGPFVQATLAAADDHPTGLQLVGATDVDPDTDFGTDALPCAVPVTGPFDPDWLLEQRCTRTDVLGATVVVQVR